jgi:hypothetical protein
MTTTWSGMARAWDHFWFEPTSTTPLGALRVATGVLLLLFAGCTLPDYTAYVGPDGFLPQPTSIEWGFNLYGLSSSMGWAWVLMAVFVAASVAFLVGWHTRVAGLLALAVLLSVQRRQPFVFNAGDVLLRLLLLFLCLAPAGAALSLDRWRAVRGSLSEFWDSPRRAPWALRLIQIQVSVVYLVTVWAKVRGTTWNDGTAVSFALRLTDLTRFSIPGPLVDSPVIVNLLTWGTLAVEFALGLLVWNRRARPVVLWIGVLFHLSIHFSLLVGLFSLVMLTGYLSFVDPPALDRLLVRLRLRFQELTQRGRTAEYRSR